MIGPEEKNGCFKAVSGIYGNGADHDLVPDKSVVSVAYGEAKAHPCDVSLCAPGVIICFFQPTCGEAGIGAGRRGDLLPDSVAVAGDSGDRLYDGGFLRQTCRI